MSRSTIEIYGVPVTAVTTLENANTLNIAIDPSNLTPDEHAQIIAGHVRTGYRCPRCGANPGKPCTGMGTTMHRERATAAGIQF